MKSLTPRVICDKDIKRLSATVHFNDAADAVVVAVVVIVAFVVAVVILHLSRNFQGRRKNQAKKIKSYMI